MLGNQIIQLRKQAGLTQSELADRLNVSASAIGMYEQERREPSVSMLISIAKVFDVTLDYLLTGEQLPGLGRGLCPCIIRKISDTALQIMFDLSAAKAMKDYSVSEITLQRSSDKVRWINVMSCVSPAEGNETSGCRAGCFIYAGTPGYFYRVSITYCTGTGEEDDCTYTATMAC